VSSWAQQVQVQVQVQERVHNKLVQEQVLDQDHNWVQVQVRGQVLVQDLEPNIRQHHRHLATILRWVLRNNTSYRRRVVAYFGHRLHCPWH
jgi:preprotein translocase subunit SecD